ncbi:MAG TPA: DPP IV N-terminal domain-containing protein [Gemmatimonadaceae bacterium]|nr:DPP IV N-terminal domain-containing protein [Gemmatimonadaceae bacterium]
MNAPKTSARLARACRLAVSAAAVALAPSASSAQTPDYHHAEQFLTWNELPLVYADYIAPHWLPDGNAFWYRVRTPRGWEFIVDDPAHLRRAPAFDNARLAAAMSLAADTSFDPTALPFTTFEFGRGGRDTGHIAFDAHARRFTCDISAYTCMVGDTLPSRVPYVRSPDGKWDAFIRGRNVYVRAAGGADSTALTTDGAERYGYGYDEPRPTQVIHPAPERPTLQWSPDSKRIAVARFDERGVLDMPLISMTSQRPKLYTYPYALPGDSVIPRFEIHLLDVAARTNTTVDVAPQNAQDNGLTGMQDSSWISVKWSGDSRHLYFTYADRGPRHVQLMEADAATGHATSLFADSSRTYVELNLESGGAPNWAPVEGGRHIVWFSERDGWGHLYLFDAHGALAHAITSGAWTVGDLVHVDSAGQWVYFTARGREAGDPYYARLYRAHLDGTMLQLLTPEAADHTVRMTPSGQYIVDTYSTVLHAPVTVVRTPDGKVVQTLETADISRLLATGWRYPVPFTVKARDGVTDLYGVMFLPSNFDSTRKYPVIDHIYPGPQIIAAPKSFYPTSSPALEYSSMGQVEALANLGFVVVEVDAMGTNLRSKAFHDAWYANMHDNGIPDHVTAIKQLAARYPFLDLDRVGIYGHSGGGFASTDAMLSYPDFYKVAVSSSGNHDNRSYYYGWAERYQGLLVRDTLRHTDNYASAANKTYVRNLAGKLFLIHGDMDDNVHPANTIQMVDALIKANKSFDLLIYPDRNHGITQEPYLIRRTWDYFVQNLMGATPPHDYRITPPPAP